MVTIGFSRTNTLLTRILSLFTKLHFRHCWIKYHNQYTGLDMIIDADLTGVIEVPYATVANSWGGITELVPPDYIDAAYWLAKVGSATMSYYDFSKQPWRTFKNIHKLYKLKNPFTNSFENAYINNVYRLLTAIDDRFHDVDMEKENSDMLYSRLLSMGWRPSKNEEFAIKGSNNHI